MPELNPLSEDERIQLEFDHLTEREGVTALFELALEGDKEAERRLIRIVHKLTLASGRTGNA